VKKPSRNHVVGAPALFRRGDWELVIVPGFGARIVSLRFEGRDVMRPTAADKLEDGLCYGFAGFPLVPYCGPTFGKGFLWEGRFVALARNVVEEPTHTHGDGWLNPWTVAERNDHSCRLIYLHQPEASGWPWRYRAELIYRLVDTGLEIAMSLRNVDSQSAPAGLGFHPYFPRPKGTLLRFDAHKVWPPDAPEAINLAPVPLGPLDFSQGLDAAETQIDRCFEGWARSAELYYPDGPRLMITATQRFSRLQIYSPIAEDYVCVEPVTNANDALNRAAAGSSHHGLFILGPDDKLLGSMSFALDM